MSRMVLRFTTIALLFTVLASCTKQETNDVYAPAPVSVNEQKLLDLVNNARARGCNCGSQYYPPVSPVKWNDKLEAAARNHSVWMDQNNTLSHTGVNGSNAGQRITAAGYTWRGYGENIAVGYPTEEEVIKGWLNSEGHCKNIMNGVYTEMGVASSGSYWTQVFATPR